MDLFILCLATILARSCVLANPGSNYCETDDIQDDLTRLIVRLQIQRIIPDYLPSTPEGVLRVEWRTAAANMGNCISPLETLYHPFFQLPDTAPFGNSTLFTISIDYPSQVAGGGISIYNLCVNIDRKRFDTQTSGFSAAPYLGPAARSCYGSLRLIAFTYSQRAYIDPNDIELLQLGAQRQQFDLVAFINRYSLGNMTAANFWIADDCCNVNFDNCCSCNANNNGCNNN